MGPLGIDPRHGFLRDRKGHVAYIDFPGATQTIPTGISNDGQVVGFYYDAPDSRSGLYRIHGFKWVNGMNDKVEIVGRYSRKAYFDPFYGAWVYETHGFVATQATGAAE
jgi:hypothetical protein